MSHALPTAGRSYRLSAEVVGGAFVSDDMLDVSVVADVHRLPRHDGDDDTPGASPPAEIVGRHEHPGQLARFAVGGRCGRDQTDMPRHGGERCYERRRFKAGVGVMGDVALERVLHCDLVGDEDSVEAGRFGNHGQVIRFFEPTSQSSRKSQAIVLRFAAHEPPTQRFRRQSPLYHAVAFSRISLGSPRFFRKLVDVAKSETRLDQFMTQKVVPDGFQAGTPSRPAHLIRVPEAARITGLPQSLLRKSFMAEGKRPRNVPPPPPHKRIGRAVYILADRLAEWIETLGQIPTGAPRGEGNRRGRPTVTDRIARRQSAPLGRP